MERCTMPQKSGKRQGKTDGVTWQKTSHRRVESKIKMAQAARQTTPARALQDVRCPSPSLSWTRRRNARLVPPPTQTKHRRRRRWR